MIAFLVFLALMIAFIVGSVCTSMYLYMRNWEGYPAEHQFVTLNEEAFLEERFERQRRNQVDGGILECAPRVVGTSLGIIAVLVLLTILFFNVIL